MQLSGKDGLIVLLGVGAVLAGAAAMTLPRIVVQPPPPALPAAPPHAEAPGLIVMVAREEVARGAEIRAESLRPLQVSALPAAAITRLDDAVGRVAVDRIAPGQIVLQDMVTGDRTRAGLAPLVPPGRRAMSVKVADDSGLGSFLRVGDLVDLIIVLKHDDLPRPNDKSDTGDVSEAKLMLNALQVLAVGDTLSENPGNEKNNKVERARLLTVAATPEQSGQIALTRHLGNYSFTLRHPTDRETPEVAAVTLAHLRGEPKKPAAKPAPAPAPRTPVARAAVSREPAIEIIRGPVAAGRGGS